MLGTASGAVLWENSIISTSEVKNMVDSLNNQNSINVLGTSKLGDPMIVLRWGGFIKPSSLQGGKCPQWIDTVGLQNVTEKTWPLGGPGLPLPLRSDLQSSKFLDPRRVTLGHLQIRVSNSHSRAPVPQFIWQPGYKMTALSSFHSCACDSLGDSTGFYKLNFH